MPTDVASLPVDLLSVAAHKMHGPKGTGALYLRRGVRIRPQVVGGPHERQLRAGTEPLDGVVGAGIAADLARPWVAGDDGRRLGGLRDAFERRIVEAVPDAVVNGAGAERLWSTTNIGFERLESEAILLLLSERGVCASAGAACSSGSLDPSPVLLAMGVPPARAHGSIRFSLSRETTEAELDRAADIVVEVVEKLRRSLPVKQI
ncbi:MAG: cysteine desulfurase family protein, partial [Planctomycetota bacterium]|jgi:cysteine desulfurase